MRAWKSDAQGALEGSGGEEDEDEDDVDYDDDDGATPMLLRSCSIQDWSRIRGLGFRV